MGRKYRKFKRTVNTKIKEVMVSTEDGTKYDDKAKKILGNKHILSRILVGTVEPLKHMTPDEVYNLIEGDPIISKVPVNPGRTNRKMRTGKGEQIVGLNTEDSEIDEGYISYDVIVYVRLPDGRLQIIVNVESQKDEPKAYMILNRVIFYICRLVSSQKERDFKNWHYNDLKSVYSIWVCMDTGENCMDYIHLTDKHLLGSHQWKGRLDLLNIYMIGLGKEVSDADDEEFRLHRLLGTVFSDGIPVEDKLKVMEEEFDIPMEEELKEDLGDMCNLSQGIVERTTKRVTEEVTERVTEKVTKEVTDDVTSRINSLNSILIRSNRLDDLDRSTKDKDFQEKLLNELVPVGNA
jgi:hypothetical protein